MEDLKWQDEEKREGGITMTIERALGIPMEEFVELSKECKGFNDEVYKNHQVHREGETIGDFIMKGSMRISKNLIIKGNLGDSGCD